MHMAKMQIKALCDNFEAEGEFNEYDEEGEEVEVKVTFPFVTWIDAYVTIEKGDLVELDCPVCDTKHGVIVVEI